MNEAYATTLAFIAIEETESPEKAIATLMSELTELDADERAITERAIEIIRERM